MFYIYDNRTGKSQGPFEREDAMKLCGKLNDEVQSKLTAAEKRLKPRQRDQRPFTFGSKEDFTASGKTIDLIIKESACIKTAQARQSTSAIKSNGVGRTTPSKRS